MVDRCWMLILGGIMEACKQSFDIEPEILMEQFIFNMKRENFETFTSYFNRFHQKYEDMRICLQAKKCVIAFIVINTGVCHDCYHRQSVTPS